MTPRRHTDICRHILAARGAGLTYLPAVWQTTDGKFHVEYRATLWDVTDWMPGVADFCANPSTIRIRAACTALASLHRVWGWSGLAISRCPAVIRRLNALADWDSIVGPQVSERISRRMPESSYVVRAWEIVAKRAPDAKQLLAPWQDVEVNVQTCLCDIWHDHVLFTGNEVTGIIDFGAVKYDSVSVDLARLLGSTVEDDGVLFAEGLDAYTAIRPLDDWQQRLIRLLDRTGVVIGLMNWLRRFLLAEAGEVFDHAAAERRMASLVLRAETWGDRWL